MFCALASPSSNVLTIGGCFDVVSRIDYPKRRAGYSFAMESSAWEFMSLAERLLPRDTREGRR